MKISFSDLAARTAYVMGTSWMFVVNVLIILGWLVLGPHFNWSTEWQLPINSATTVTTWLLAILILNDSSRNAAALHVKLDALILADKNASNRVAGAEELRTEEITSLKSEIRSRE